MTKEKIQNSEGNYFQTRIISLNKSSVKCEKHFQISKGLKCFTFWKIKQKEKAKQLLIPRKTKGCTRDNYVRNIYVLIKYRDDY